MIMLRGGVTATFLIAIFPIIIRIFQYYSYIEPYVEANQKTVRPLPVWDQHWMWVAYGQWAVSKKLISSKESGPAPTAHCPPLMVGVRGECDLRFLHRNEVIDLFLFLFPGARRPSMFICSYSHFLPHNSQQQHYQHQSWQPLLDHHLFFLTLLLVIQVVNLLLLMPPLLVVNSNLVIILLLALTFCSDPPCRSSSSTTNKDVTWTKSYHDETRNSISNCQFSVYVGS